MNLQDKLEKFATNNGATVADLPKGEFLTSGKSFDKCVEGYKEFCSPDPIGVNPIALVDHDFIDDTKDENSFSIIGFLMVGVSDELDSALLINENGIIMLTLAQVESLEKALQLAKSKLK